MRTQKQQHKLTGGFYTFLSFGFSFPGKTKKKKDEEHVLLRPAFICRQL